MRDEDLKLERAIETLTKAAMPKKDDPEYFKQKAKVLEAQLAIYQYLVVVEEILVATMKNIDSLSPSVDSADYSKWFGVITVFRALMERLRKKL